MEVWVSFGVFDMWARFAQRMRRSDCQEKATEILTSEKASRTQETTPRAGRFVKGGRA